MRIELPLSEALALGEAQGAIPPFVHDIRVVGSAVHLQVDAGQVMGRSGGLARFLGGLAGRVPIAATFTGWADGVATLTVTAESRGIPLHRFLPLIEGQIKAKLREQGIPEGAVDVRTGAGDPVVAVDVRRLLASKVSGLVVTDLRLQDATLHVTAALDPGVRFRVL
ncbi:hypothetical protein ICW40_01530 [Actinotalea ferrariae]|uniref:hypothetical protein n=1 Tax=Actinotalea ferrariae TaxID=1386098 RepID=UPI001C8B0F6D|nr:hypothetical protein [Actinotalea ferrariae]MBX9243485.1 hypothetical protein [Actinotalea ferrariae]